MRHELCHQEIYISHNKLLTPDRATYSQDLTDEIPRREVALFML